MQLENGQKVTEYYEKNIGPDDVIGSRKGFKTPCPKGRAGSNPALAIGETNEKS